MSDPRLSTDHVTGAFNPNNPSRVRYSVGYDEVGGTAIDARVEAGADDLLPPEHAGELDIGIGKPYVILRYSSEGDVRERAEVGGGIHFTVSKEGRVWLNHNNSGRVYDVEQTTVSPYVTAKTDGGKRVGVEVDYEKAEQRTSRDYPRNGRTNLRRATFEGTRPVESAHVSLDFDTRTNRFVLKVDHREQKTDDFATIVGVDYVLDVGEFSYHYDDPIDESLLGPTMAIGLHGGVSYELAPGITVDLVAAGMFGGERTDGSYTSYSGKRQTRYDSDLIARIAAEFGVKVEF
jgi:hypothetical protein